MVKASGWRNDRQPVDLQCPLPEDLRAALGEGFVPVDKASEIHFAAWLSGDTARLCSFEQYVDSVRVAANLVAAAGAKEK